MASPQLQQRTYRLTNIPSSLSHKEVRKLFGDNISLIERTSLASSANDKNLKVATVTFSEEPPCLLGRKQKSGLLKDILHLNDPKFHSIGFDDSFEGLTRLTDGGPESFS